VSDSLFARYGYHANARWYPEFAGRYVQLRVDVVYCRARDLRREDGIRSADYCASSLSMALTAQAGCDASMGHIVAGTYAYRLLFGASPMLGLEPHEVAEAARTLAWAKRRGLADFREPARVCRNFGEFVRHWLRPLGVDTLVILGRCPIASSADRFVGATRVALSDAVASQRALLAYENDALSAAAMPALAATHPAELAA